MKYDIHLSIAGIIIYILLLLDLRVQYNNGQNSVKKFRQLIICLMLADIADVVTAYTIYYFAYIPLWVNYVLNSTFFILETLCIYMLTRYIRFVLDPEEGKKVFWDKINEIIIILFGLLCATSFANHTIFYFEGSKYKHGSLYDLTYGLGLYFQAYSFIRLMVNRHKFSKRQFYSIIGFIIISVSGSVVQFLIPANIFVLYFAFSIAAFVTMFGLETPDYMKLQKTLEELERSKEELQEAVIRAEKADMAKSDFLANMSHEIRTPINAVLGMNELISRESTQPSIQKYSSNLADAGASLLSLVNDILDFSKIEAGKMEISEAEYELSTLLREVNNTISIRCEDKGIRFIIKNDPDIPNKLYGDDVRIRQILINLLNNAMKYTEKGEVILNITFERIDDKSIKIAFEVKDTGIGIKEEDIPALFESFKRIDIIHNRRREGTGLGLNITKSLVEMMAGKIEVHSIYGQGSTFAVTIVQEVKDWQKIGIFADAKDEPKREKYAASFKAPKAHILVVDDVKMNLIVLKGLLKQTDIQVDLASSGKECLEKIKEMEYDLIFLDHMMPEMDGIETMNHIREDNSHKNVFTPVIMLTANAIVGAKEEYLQCGFQDYLSKPVPWKELEEMLVKYLPKDKVDIL